MPEFPAWNGIRRHRRHRLDGRHRTPGLYRLIDRITEPLVYGMVIFTPWAFGTTQPWAIWTMNIAGYALGLLLALKWAVRRRMEYAPPRWGGGGPRWLTWLLGLLTVLLLGWCLISAVNARATLVFAEMRFEYRDNSVPWLPHSYHAPATWFAFWQYLGLACAFWALRDWLLGRTRRERLDHDEEPKDSPAGDAADEESPVPLGSPLVLPTRLRGLLWVLCLNGSLLALEGLLQRFDGTNKLLWLIEPRFTNTPEQFGPYAYRSNAAEYLNLVWPVCFGLWWCLRRDARRGWRRTLRVGSSPHLVLLPCAVLMAAAPVISTARGGALVTFALLPLAGAVLLFADWRQGLRNIGIVILTMAAAVALAIGLGWSPLKKRLLAPRDVYAFPLTNRLEQFTLRSVFRVPPPPIQSWSRLVALSDFEKEDYGTPRSVVLFLGPGGTLHWFHFGADPTNFERRITTTGVATNYCGKVIDVAAVYDHTINLYVNGSRVETYLYLPKTNAPPLVEVGSAYLHVLPDQEVFESPPALISLYPVALPPDDLANLCKELSQGHLTATESDNLPKPVIELTQETIRAPAPLLYDLSGRREIYASSQQMLRDFPWLGSGPGTFGPLYGLYRQDLQGRWAWYAHDDWLETRITFGPVAAGLIALALALVFLRWLGPGGLPVPRVLVRLTWLAMAGCLLHAKFDFPFQIYSVTFLFVLLASISFTVSRR